MALLAVLCGCGDDRGSQTTTDSNSDPALDHAAELDDTPEPGLDGDADGVVDGDLDRDSGGVDAADLDRDSDAVEDSDLGGDGEAVGDLARDHADVPRDRDLVDQSDATDSIPACYFNDTVSAFVDISDRLDPIDTTASHPSGLAGGVALADFDGDGLLDIVVASEASGLRWLRQSDGRFEDVSDAKGLDGVTPTNSVTHADFDGDGDPDLWAGGMGRSWLLANDGGVFVDVSETWGLFDPDTAPTDLAIRASAAFGDYDRDGDLDLYETGYWYPAEGQRQPNRLWNNRGDRFDEVAGGPGSQGDARRPALAATWSDFNGDGHLDLWVANDFGMLHGPNQLFINQGPELGFSFVDSAEALGFDQSVFAMSATLGDIDNDLDLDGYVSNIADGVLLRVGEGGVAQDVAGELGVGAGHVQHSCEQAGDAVWMDLDPDDPSEVIRAMTVFCADYCQPGPDNYVATAWSSVFLDADHNGSLDLFVPRGLVGVAPLLPEAEAQSNVLFTNEGGVFTESEGVIPPMGGSSRGAAVGDLDRDGDLDLVWVDNAVDGPARVVVLENQYATGHWLQLELVGTVSPRQPVGARAILTTGAGAQLRQLGAGEGILSAGEPILHFGLGAEESVVALEIHWPSGAVHTVEVPQVDQRLVVVEPE